ncbi:hypothetical protein B9Z55_001917 [Caenorhabditis nigoni]|uniref:Uncharacterized protein n=1 Tax=Caenorhabditis nigoni TaxID=1611254 RepID=A0A2G5VIG3_9PELO|nr:hypothetical protein B9Z55_001917 [Caenorhabditis nigoni]
MPPDVNKFIHLPESTKPFGTKQNPNRQKVGASKNPIKLETFQPTMGVFLMSGRRKTNGNGEEKRIKKEKDISGAKDCA